MVVRDFMADDTDIRCGFHHAAGIPGCEALPYIL